MVLIGAGSIGIACARRIATGKHLIIGDINSKTAKKVEEDLYNAGFETSSVQVDLRPQPARCLRPRPAQNPAECARS